MPLPYSILSLTGGADLVSSRFFPICQSTKALVDNLNLEANISLFLSKNVQHWFQMIELIAKLMKVWIQKTKAPNVLQEIAQKKMP